MQARLFSQTSNRAKYFRSGLQFSLSVSIGIAAGLAVGALEKAYDANALAPWDWDWVTVSDITTAVVSVATHNLLKYAMSQCCHPDPQQELETQSFRRYSSNIV